jgi:hypothetical protein
MHENEEEALFQRFTYKRKEQQQQKKSQGFFVNGKEMGNVWDGKKISEERENG